MTAPTAAASAAPPTAPTPNRAASLPSADPFAFAAVLDTLPSAPAKTGAPTAEEQAHRSHEPPQQDSSRGRTAHHSLLNDSALMASLPFALRAAAMMNELPQAADDLPSPALPAAKAPKSEGGGASIAGGAKANVGRLIGERTFHFGASTPAWAAARGAFATDAPFTPAAANLTDRTDIKGESASLASFARGAAAPAEPLTEAVPSMAKGMAPPPTASPALSQNRPSLSRAAPHEAVRSGRKPEIAAPPPVAHASSSASPAPAGSNAAAPDRHAQDPALSAASSATPSSPFGAQLSAPFVGGASFEPNASMTTAANTDAAPRASAPAAGSGSSTAPVREIDVDLSPGGLENVSMTMRLTGEKLSVVIHAASSHTMNSIEGARDAIADRLAAIGQPLDSLIVRQTGVNTDGNGKGNMGSADRGSAEGEGRSAQSAGDRGGSNDALSRRGAGRDRSF